MNKLSPEEIDRQTSLAMQFVQQLGKEYGDNPQAALTVALTTFAAVASMTGCSVAEAVRMTASAVEHAIKTLPNIKSENRKA